MVTKKPTITDLLNYNLGHLALFCPSDLDVFGTVSGSLFLAFATLTFFVLFFLISLYAATFTLFTAPLIFRRDIQSRRFFLDIHQKPPILRECGIRL